MKKTVTKRFKLLSIGLFVAMIANCQISDSILIIGQLISKDKNPLPGVLISIRDLEKGTVSDACGYFNILVPTEAVIDFSLISEPYYISMCEIDPKSDTSKIIFQFDFKQNDNNCSDKLSKAKRIKLEKRNRDIYSQKLIACYKSDFERLTWKYYNYYHDTDKDILFVINGYVMDDDFSPDRLQFQDLEQVFIFDNQSCNSNILFIISMIDKGRKEKRP